MAQPHGRDGLSAWRMAVLWTFREPSLCRRVRRALMRNALLDYTLIIPATACHQSNYVETYSRYMLAFKLTQILCVPQSAPRRRSAARARGDRQAPGQGSAAAGFGRTGAPASAGTGSAGRQGTRSRAFGPACSFTVP